MTATPPSSPPRPECDIVMKGGVTSGIVYPGAVAAIAEDYRLRSVGGTSAGAIGAAAAAAMEFGRRSGRNPDARTMLAELAQELGVQHDGSPLLLRLFEPDPPTAPLFNLAMEFAQKGKAAGARRLFAMPALMGLLLSGGLVAILGSSFPAPLTVGPLVTLGLLFLLGIVALTLLIGGLKWVPVLTGGLNAAAENGFGFCSGMARHRTGTGDYLPALTEWMHAKYQLLAGLDPSQPLCFGDLWAASFREPALSREKALSAARRAGTPAGDDPVALDIISRDIELVLVASDINRAQSVQLPFMRREDRLYVRLSDLRTLFPQEIVTWMQEHQGVRDLEEVALGAVPADDLIRLPRPENLPVLFAVRMSLSFPFLFRAVRLYVVRRTSAGGEELAEIWLADGGITSNFPIHLFDSPIPARPTFCLNLLYHDDELEPDEPPAPRTADLPEEEEGPGLSMRADAPPEQLVYMLRTNRGRVSAYTRFAQGGGLGGLLRFGGRIVTTARQWGDNQLIDVPGYRDRIVHIRMRSSEGGFNFNMDAGQIADLERRGARAGSVIARRFLPAAVDDPLHPGSRLTLNWANHRMIRFRAFLAGLEVSASRFRRNWTRDFDLGELPQDDPAQIRPSLSQMIDQARPGRMGTLAQPTGYPFRSDEQGDLAHEMVDMVLRLSRLSEDNPQVTIDFVHGKSTSPRPKAVVKLRPPLDTDPQSERP